jgi:hypothetical protein
MKAFATIRFSMNRERSSFVWNWDTLTLKSLMSSWPRYREASIISKLRWKF